MEGMFQQEPVKIQWEYQDPKGDERALWSLADLHVALHRRMDSMQLERSHAVRLDAWTHLPPKQSDS